MYIHKLGIVPFIEASLFQGLLIRVGPLQFTCVCEWLQISECPFHPIMLAVVHETQVYSLFMLTDIIHVCVMSIHVGVETSV